MSSLTFDQAVESWKHRWSGRKVRDIVAVYDVDPRRLYEVWQEDIHSGSKSIAYQQLKHESPELAPAEEPPRHSPRFKVVPRDRQLDLFDDSDDPDDPDDPYGDHFRKLPISAKPSFWLFSG
ncbi:hypothetical protein [Bauldia sp.]|uniref:hypothetical protein n=1 Tax=Bauldia sp. TaxID=2575872 RepID=UPI003BAD3071